MFPDTRTTFGVVEMTTGCGRRCKFCVPDLNPQIDLPKDKIMDAVRANVREGNKQISLATEDMFIWGQVHTDTPFYFPNREALVDLYKDIVETPGVEQHVLSHSTIAPAVVDPIMIKQLSDILAAEKSDPFSVFEHASREKSACAVDRFGNRFDKNGEEDNGKQSAFRLRLIIGKALFSKGCAF